MSKISVSVTDGTNVNLTISPRPVQTITVSRGSATQGTVTQVTANTPLSVTNGTTTPDLSIAQANASTAGYLTAGDWSTFNSKVATVSGTAPVTVTGTTNAVISMPAASSTTNGYLSSGLYNTFNNKIGGITSLDNSVTVTTYPGAVRDLSVASSPNVIVQIRNNTGATLTKGTAVYINGAIGQLPTVTKAQANTDAASAQTLGLMTTDLANNSNGYVTIIGLITNFDTSAYTDGQQLYLSPTVAGGLTATKPSAPQHLVYVAVVEHAHITQGKLFVKVQNGYELDELHDVQIVSPTNGQTITYDSATSLWKNTTPTSGGVTSVSGTGTVSGISLSGTVTSTGNLTLGGSLNLSSPPAIGGTTPAAITGTTVSATTQITLPTVTVGNAGTGVLQMIDGLDGYDYLNIYTDDGSGNGYIAKFPYGLNTTTITGLLNLAAASIISAGSFEAGAGAITLYGTFAGTILQASNAALSSQTFTFPSSTGSNNQVLKTDGSGNLDWVTQGVQGTAPVTVTTATHTVAATTQWLIANRAGTVTLTLPTASSNTGRSLNVKTITANTVISNASNVVPLTGGAAGTAILAATAGKFATLVSDGSNWIIMAAN